MDSKYALIFILASVVVDLFIILEYSQNKSCKIYTGLMLAPGDRNWQLIYPNFTKKYLNFCQAYPQNSD